MTMGRDPFATACLFRIWSSLSGVVTNCRPAALAVARPVDGSSRCDQGQRKPIRRPSWKVFIIGAMPLRLRGCHSSPYRIRLRPQRFRGTPTQRSFYNAWPLGMEAALRIEAARWIPPTAKERQPSRVVIECLERSRKRHPPFPPSPLIVLGRRNGGTGLKTEPRSWILPARVLPDSACAAGQLVQFATARRAPTCASPRSRHKTRFNVATWHRQVRATFDPVLPSLAISYKCAEHSGHDIPYPPPQGTAVSP